MSGIRFSDPQDREDVIALGLPAGRLGVAGAGLGTALELLRTPLPAFLQVSLAGLTMLASGALAWVCWDGLSLAGWVGRAVRFGWRRGRARAPWTAADGDGRGRG
jgi:hypothetical protein